jgi:hypothetical protein
MGVPMVSSAQQAKVVDLGSSAVGPVLDVMSIAPAGRDLAAGMGAVLIALFEGPAEGIGNDAGGAADLDGSR